MAGSDPKTILSWSGGKDAYLALREYQSKGEIVSGLFCTMDEELRRVSMHGVPSTLIEEQAESLEIPLTWVEIPHSCSMEEYSQIFKRFFKEQSSNGFDKVIFGDIFLEDLRDYRMNLVSGTGLEPIFPLWGKDTRELSQKVANDNIRTITVAVSNDRLGKEFCGRYLDLEFLHDLPEEVDPCGENGEFHTFVTDGPEFSHPIPVEVMEIVKRGYGANSGGWDHEFWFADLGSRTTP